MSGTNLRSLALPARHVELLCFPIHQNVVRKACALGLALFSAGDDLLFLLRFTFHHFSFHTRLWKQKKDSDRRTAPIGILYHQIPTLLPASAGLLACGSSTLCCLPTAMNHDSGLISSSPKSNRKKPPQRHKDHKE